MRWTAPSTLETFGVTSIMVMESRQKLPACDFFRELAHVCTMKNLGICMNLSGLARWKALSGYLPPRDEARWQSKWGVTISDGWWRLSGSVFCSNGGDGDGLRSRHISVEALDVSDSSSMRATFHNLRSQRMRRSEHCFWNAVILDQYGSIFVENHNIQ